MEPVVLTQKALTQKALTQKGSKKGSKNDSMWRT